MAFLAKGISSSLGRTVSKMPRSFSDKTLVGFAVIGAGCAIIDAYRFLHPPDERPAYTGVCGMHLEMFQRCIYKPMSNPNQCQFYLDMLKRCCDERIADRTVQERK